MERTERDERILRFVARYKIATVDVLARVFFEGLSQKSAERVVGRLRKHKLLVGYPLFDRQYYYTLTRQGARVLGLDEKRAGESLGLQALTLNYSMLLFCQAGEKRVKRLTRDEFVSHFPALALSRPAGSSQYYLQRVPGTDDVQICLMLTDMGSHPRRLARKCRRQFYAREEASVEWRRSVEADMFSVTLLTAFERKARKVRQMLEQDPFPIRVRVVPGLAPLLTSLTRPRPGD